MNRGATISPVLRKQPAWLLLLVLLGCDGGPSSPSSASLQLSILGLPAGTAAAVTVTGPNNFSQAVTATQTFSQLTPGVYTVTAATVTAGNLDYDPSPRSQTVSVGINGSQSSALVSYSRATGSLTITINGLGTSRSAVVNVAGPGGYGRMVDATTTLDGLDPGDYTITASDAAAIGCATHTASPTTQTATVVARTTVTATVDYSAPPSTGSVNLCIAGMYVTQSVQDIAGSVPLVQGRDGYLRVFVVADRANAVTPTVQVRLYNLGVLSSTLTIPPSGLTSVPTTIDESSLAYSWDTTLSGSIIKPGLAIQAEVNPAGPGALPETDPSDNVYPATGPMPLTVQTVPTLDVTLVPVRQSGSLLTGRVTAVNQDSFLVMTQRMHPIDTFNIVLHATYTTKTNLTLQPDNSNGAWGTILGEIDALRITEHSPRYYYGVARVTYSSGVAGVAYVSQSGTAPGSGQRAALGWDYLGPNLTGSIVAAHELGHNWGRSHAPCGGPLGVDPQYPRPDGSTGRYGMDVIAKTVEASTLGDIMGYCDPKWISDYTYLGVMSYLRAPSPPLLSVTSADIQPCLLVWGRIQNGGIELEPAFQIDTRPSLPSRRGGYSLEGRDASGQSLFSLSFEPNTVVDAPVTQQNFVFALPLSKVGAGRLASLRVSGQGRQASITDSAGTVVQNPNTVPPEARRVANGRVALRWDSRTHPMVMVRDPDTGEVLSFARGGEVEVATSKARVDLLLSSGVRSQLRRMQVSP